jgi:hypothetical protein
MAEVNPSDALSEHTQAVQAKQLRAAHARAITVNLASRLAPCFNEITARRWARPRLLINN